MFWPQDPLPNTQSNRRRRNRGLNNFPWFIVFFFWFTPSYWWIWLLVAAGAFFLLNAARLNSQQSYSQRQQPAPPYYVPSQPVSPQAPLYQPYEQGYQVEASQEGYREEQNSGTASESESHYQEYDQPMAEYPQQLPPM
jgi:hypothetical protein